MKTNVNNSENKYTRKAIEALKSEIKANAIEEIELTKYGIQIYAAYLNTEEYVEFYVVMKAERDLRTGRYYFITREGERIAWSRLTAETLTVAAVDFLDAIESEEKRAAEALARLECYGLQHLESRFFFLWVRPLLDTIGTAYHIEATGFNDLGETIDLVTIDNGDHVPAWDAIEAAPSDVLATWKADRIAKAEALHAAAWYVAAVKASELTGQISEEQERRRKASEAADRFEASAVDRVKTAAEYLTKGARVVLLAVTLTTGTPADAETIESEPQAADVAELLTTDPVNELAALRAAGLTVARFEIKTAPATLREVAAC